MTDQWIHCGALVVGDGTKVLPDMGVRIHEDRIAEVRSWPAEGFGDVPVLDRTDSTLTPGFIDLHTHLLFTCDVDHELTRGAVEFSSPATLALTGARNALECLLGGITTVRDCGDIDFITLDLRDAIAERVMPGPRLLAAGPPVTTTGGHLHWCGNAADSPDELRKATRASCARGVDFVKVMASGGVMTAGTNPLLPQYSVAELEIVVQEAHRLGRRVAAHALNTESIRRAVRAGVDTIEHCIPRSEEGIIGLPDDLVDEMIDRQVWVSLTMAGISRLLLPELAIDRSALADDDDRAIEHDAALAVSDTGSVYDDHDWARTLYTRGVPMALSSDAGVRFTPFRRFDLSLRAGMVALGISAVDAIGMATGAAARAAGIEAEVGTIAAGQRADVVFLDGVLTDQSTSIGSITEVWQDGTTVIRDGAVVAGKDGVHGLA